MHISKTTNSEGRGIPDMICPLCHSAAVQETSVMMKAHGVTVKFFCLPCQMEFSVDYLAVRATWLERVNDQPCVMQVLKHWFA
jgi:hypothetical protein